MSLLGTILRIELHDKIEICGRGYVLVETTAGGYILARDDAKLRAEAFTYEEIWNHHLAGRLEIKRGSFSRATAALKLLSGVDSLDQLPEEERAYCLHAASCCDEFLRLHNEDPDTYCRTRLGYERAARVIGALKYSEAMERPHQTSRSKRAAPAIDAAKKRRARAGDPVTVLRAASGRNLERWVPTYEAHNLHPLALRKQHFRCGRSESPLQAEILAILARTAASYLDERRPSVPKLHRDMKAEIEKDNIKRAENGEPLLIVPSDKALTSTIKRKYTPFQIEAARKSIRSAERRFGVVSSGVDADWPGARVEIDESKLPIMTLLKSAGIWESLGDLKQELLRSVQRLWIVSAIDVATGVILGFVLTRNPGADALLSVLSLATRDKSAIVRGTGARSRWDMACGADTIATDAGAAVTSDDVRGAIIGMGCKNLIGPVAQPQLRGTKERFFGVVNTDLLAGYTGQTFSNPVVRGDYHSEARASIDGDDLALDIARWLVDVHHLTPSPAMRGETPIDRWRRLASTRGIVPPLNSNQRRVLFGIRVFRKPGPRGVVVLGNHYQSTDIQQYIRDTSDIPAEGLEISVDQHDLGAVSVRLGRDWYELPAMDETLDGIPLTLHVEAMRQMRVRFGDQAEVHAHVVHEARLAIRQRSEDAIAKAALGPTRPTEATVNRAEGSISIAITAREYLASRASDETDKMPLRFRTARSEQRVPTASSSELANFSASPSTEQDESSSDQQPSQPYWSVRE
jgi:putative transposase